MVPSSIFVLRKEKQDMALFEYQLDDHVALVTMNHGENRFTYDFLEAF